MKVCTLFRRNAFSHLVDYIIVQTIFICTGKPNNSRDSLYCGVRFIVVVQNPTCSVFEVCL